MAHTGSGGFAGRASRRRPDQAHGGAGGHCRGHCPCRPLHLGANRPRAARNPPGRADVQPRQLGRPPEKARPVLYPDTAHAEKKRCPDQFKAAQANLKRCQAAARAGKLSLFYLDESGFSTVPNVQRAWSPKGKPHAADAGAPRARVNVVGALDYATGTVWHDLHTKSVKRDAVVALVDRIAKREERMPLTLVVLDNARTHHNIDPDILDGWLVEHRLVLMHLPPYSPELNLIEIVWKHLKYHWRRFVTWSKEELFEQVQNLMTGIGSSFKISFSYKFRLISTVHTLSAWYKAESSTPENSA
ncbi:MAG: IS630 family transposase [Nitrososphaera sp.]|nr:IS630 family transposase [Nitrososphaera sp.]